MRKAKGAYEQAQELVRANALIDIADLINKAALVPDKEGRAPLCSCKNPTILEKSYCTKCGRDIR